MKYISGVTLLVFASSVSIYAQMYWKPVAYSKTKAMRIEIYGAEPKPYDKETIMATTWWRTSYKVKGRWKPAYKEKIIILCKSLLYTTVREGASGTIAPISSDESLKGYSSGTTGRIALMAACGEAYNF